MQDEAEVDLSGMLLRVVEAGSVEERVGNKFGALPLIWAPVEAAHDLELFLASGILRGAEIVEDPHRRGRGVCSSVPEKSDEDGTEDI